MHNPFVIALDCDGVMCSFTGGVVSHVNEHIRIHPDGVPFSDDHITEWHVDKALRLSEEENQKLVAHIKTEGFCYNLPVVPGTAEALLKLRAFARVICVTSPYPSKYWEWERRSWLMDKLSFEKKDIVFADDKNLVCADVLLDDKMETILSYTKGEPVLFEQPWNRNIMQEKNHLVVSDWGSFVRLARMMEGCR